LKQFSDGWDFWEIFKAQNPVLTWVLFAMKYAFRAMNQSALYNLGFPIDDSKQSGLNDYCDGFY